MMILNGRKENNFTRKVEIVKALEALISSTKWSLCSLKVKINVLDFSSTAQKMAISDQSCAKYCARCV